MKKLLSLLLCVMMLACTAPTVISGADTAVFKADACSPAAIDGNSIKIADTVSVAEVLSYFKNKSDLTALDRSGDPMELDADAPSGMKIVSGDGALTLVVLGDVHGDGRLNVRDVLDAMKAIIAKEAPAAADVNADGVLNAKDVVTLMRRLVGWDEPFGEEAKIASLGESDVKIYFDSLMHRVGRSDTNVYGAHVGLIRMAKNELEDASVFIVSGKQREGVKLEVSELKNDAGDSLGVTVFDGFA